MRKAVTFDVSRSGHLLTMTMGRFMDSAVFGRLSGVSYGPVAEPDLPGDAWVSLDVILAGICGVDLAALTFSRGSGLGLPGSFPAVPGHEILARVRGVGRKVTRVEPGQRVVMDPIISCTVRGYGDDPCPACRNGAPAGCRRAGEEGALEVAGRPLAPGIVVGFHRDLPGGWGSRMIAHQSQLFPVGEGLDDQTAVLIEPLSAGVRAVLGARPHPDAPVLVVGSGLVALGTIWALRAMGFRGRLLARIGRPHEAGAARILGATEVVLASSEVREPAGGGPFPVIFDCAGSESSVSRARRLGATPGGRVITVGCAAGVREPEPRRGGVGHPFEVTRELLAETGAPVGRLVTHLFPLDQYRDALSAAAHPGRSEAVKVLLKP